MSPTPIIVAFLVATIAIILIELSRGGSLSGKKSFADLVGLAQVAGFSGQDAITAAGIAMAESGGDPRAYNPETAANTPEGKGSYGLWQIYLKDHPEFTNADLYDPPTNANAAFSIYTAAGNSFRPWSTYNSGRYLSVIPGGYNV